MKRERAVIAVEKCMPKFSELEVSTVIATPDAVVLLRRILEVKMD